jgi:hypothetical protein
MLKAEPRVAKFLVFIQVMGVILDVTGASAQASCGASIDHGKALRLTDNKGNTATVQATSEDYVKRTEIFKTYVGIKGFEAVSPSGGVFVQTDMLFGLFPELKTTTTVSSGMEAVNANNIAPGDKKRIRAFFPLRAGSEIEFPIKASVTLSTHLVPIVDGAAMTVNMKVTNEEHVVIDNCEYVAFAIEQTIYSSSFSATSRFNYAPKIKNWIKQTPSIQTALGKQVIVKIEEME